MLTDASLRPRYPTPRRGFITLLVAADRFWCLHGRRAASNLAEACWTLIFAGVNLLLQKRSPK